MNVSFWRQTRSNRSGRGFLILGLCLVVLPALGACERHHSREKAESELLFTSQLVADDLAVFRNVDGCYPHAQAGLRLVLSERCFRTFKNPDGSFTAALPNRGINPMKTGECYYLNPAAGTLANAGAKVVLAVLVETDYGHTLVIDSSCARYLLRSGASRDPKALLGKPVAELESTGSIAKSFRAPMISSGKPPAPWQPTCSKPEHLPWWCE